MTATLPTALLPGYEVIEHLSRGDALDVFDVYDLERDCRCVVKLLRPDRRLEPEATARLRQEGQVLSELTHPHFVRLYEVVEEPELALVLETLGGETLAHMIDTRRRRLPLVELAHLGTQLCSAIGYLHRRGWLHLDLKPSNVVCEAGLVKVIDLSVVSRPGPGRRGVGTAQYMAPEQARGGELDEATDAWGIGAVLFEAATGRRPFAEARDGDYAQLRYRAPRVSALRRIDAEFAEVVDACLEPDPRNRPAVRDVGARLAPFAL